MSQTMYQMSNNKAMSDYVWLQAYFYPPITPRPYTDSPPLTRPRTLPNTHPIPFLAQTLNSIEGTGFLHFSQPISFRFWILMCLWMCLDEMIP